MPAYNIHVVPAHNGWAVETENHAGARQFFSSQNEAVAAGTEKAREERVDLFVHGLDGRIRMRTSFGNDPRGIKD